jgi:ligand-binding SRPBCC domain-containing protein
MKLHSFDSAIWIPAPIDAVFSFFSDAHNLERITPPFLQFNVDTPDPIVIAVGTRIRYRLRLRGIPISWESEITAWDPPHRFIDEQIRGPYRVWRHEHRFAEQDTGTQVSDHVRYAVWGGSLVNSLFVAPDVRKIFEYRRSKLTELFPPISAAAHGA